MLLPLKGLVHSLHSAGPPYSLARTYSHGHLYLQERMGNVVFFFSLGGMKRFCYIKRERERLQILLCEEQGKGDIRGQRATTATPVTIQNNETL